MHEKNHDEIEAPKVIFISSSSYSGSTLLGLLLGAQPHIFNAGEISKNYEIYQNNFKIDPKNEVDNYCTCGKKYNKCPVWKEVFEKHDFSYDFNPGPGFSWMNLKLLIRILLRIPSQIDYKKAQAYQLYISHIYSAAKKHDSQITTILDNSKSLYNLYLLNLSDGIDPKVIHITRNGVNVSNSYRKHGVNPFKGFTMWVLSNITNLLYLRRVKHTLFIQYNDLCTQLSENFTKINNFLTTNLHQNSYFEEIKNCEFHIITGNPLLNDLSKLKTIQLNTKTPYLSFITKKIIQILCFPFNKLFKIT